MFQITDLYDLLKPEGDEDSITSYEVIFGALGGFGDEAKGLIIINLISLVPLSNSIKRYMGNNQWVTQSMIQMNLQMDFYRGSEHHDLRYTLDESAKIQEFLKGPTVRNFLKKRNAEILPNYNNLNFDSYQNDKREFITRSGFEFSLISYVEKEYENVIIDKIKFENKEVVND